MNVVLSKTLVFISFMIIGALLKFKFDGKQETDGLKKIILNLALPATIFIALLQVKVEIEFLLLPLLALAFNSVLFLITPGILYLVGERGNTAIGRTTRMLLPSLAPGLSCFPFVLEFLGQEYLAKAAMADLGNKFFVLLVLYLVAVKWFRKNCEGLAPEKSRRSKVVALLKKMFSEPVNLLMFLAILFIFLGIDMDDFPVFLKDIVERLSYIMTPLVLLYIGLALKLKRNQLEVIFSLLAFRAGFALLMGAALIYLTGIQVREDMLLLLAFGLSACSFWPFMHIAMVDGEETELGMERKTFDTGFAIALLAFSLPVSVVCILFVLSSATLFTNLLHIVILGVVLFGLGLLPSLWKGMNNALQKTVPEKYQYQWKELLEEEE